MSRNNANSDKTGGFPLEPVTVTVGIDDEQITIDAAHHVINDEAKLLRLYIEERQGGWDVTVPLARDDAAWADSDIGRRALGLDTHSDDADAGADDAEVVADGGRDVPACECGADLIETAELTTSAAPDAGARGPTPSMHTVPDAECTNCARSVGAMFGTEAALAVWEARGETLPGDDDDDDDDRRVFRVGAGDPPVFDDEDSDEDDGRLMTDGGLGRRKPGAHEGRPITPDNPATTVDIGTVERGDTVTHVSGAVAGHVINTWVQDLQAHGYRDVVEYVTVDGDKVRSEAFELITVCRQCGDIVLPDPDTGHVASHGDADDCCNGGE
jgi:hypothetical protein